MRKIQPTLQSQGYDNFDDLLSKSLPKSSSIITVGPDNCDYTSLVDAIANATSGNLIVVYPGTYDCGDQSIILKDGVNWLFFPGVTITSSSTTGTFHDNNVAVNVRIDGFPHVLNTYNLNKRFYVQNAATRIKGFYFEFQGDLQQSSGGVWTYTRTPNRNTIDNDLSGSGNQVDFLIAEDTGWWSVHNLFIGSLRSQLFLPSVMEKDGGGMVFISTTSNGDIFTYDGVNTGAGLPSNNLIWNELYITIRAYPSH